MKLPVRPPRPVSLGESIKKCNLQATEHDAHTSDGNGSDSVEGNQKLSLWISKKLLA